MLFILSWRWWRCQSRMPWPIFGQSLMRPSAIHGKLRSTGHPITWPRTTSNNSVDISHWWTNDSQYWSCSKIKWKCIGRFEKDEVSEVICSTFCEILTPPVLQIIIRKAERCIIDSVNHSLGFHNELKWVFRCWSAFVLKMKVDVISEVQHVVVYNFKIQYIFFSQYVLYSISQPYFEWTLVQNFFTIIWNPFVWQHLLLYQVVRVMKLVNDMVS